jgi:hypothetical protein
MLLLSALLIAFLVYLSILSAFYGSARAAAFFNSLGMAVFWLVLLAALVISFFVFKPFRRKLGPMLIHLACILILSASMWGSQRGHEMRRQYLGENRFYEGYLVLHETSSEARLITKDQTSVIGELPFNLALKKFTILYHPSVSVADIQPRQFRSSVLFVSREGTQLDEKSISVNHPAAYGGYHFYQSSYGRDHHGTYSVLHVRAFSGLHVLYAGYSMLCIGMVWSLWLKALLPVVHSYKGGDSYGY